MKFISKETSKRVCDHMNNDHIDSVHKYLIHYGKISSFENAYMEEINNSYIISITMASQQLSILKMKYLKKKFIQL